MGKKKSKGSKKKQKIVDGLLPVEMSRPQLLGHAVRLQAELEKEKEERNYYMLEREKIFQLWNLLLEQIQLEKEKAALFNSHLQDTQKMKDDEDNLYNQKLRFLKQEHTRKLGQVRLYHLSQMKYIQDDAWTIQMVMREALMGKKKEIRQAQMGFYQIIRGLHWKHAKEVSDLRSEFAREIRRLETSFDRRLFESNEKEDEKQEKQVAKSENTEAQINGLIESHRYQTKELQKFFRDLIGHNLNLIYGMKDVAKKQKTMELRARKDLEGFKTKYKKYVSPAVKWKQDMETWQVEHANDDLEELVQELNDGNEEVKRLRHTQRMTECSNETLKQRISIAEKEKDCLRKEFARSIVDVQKKMCMNRFVSQIKKKGAKREGDFYEALCDNVEKDKGDDTDYFMTLLSSRDKEKMEVKGEIIEYATEHQNVEKNYKDNFKKNEINLADIGFPIKRTGVMARGNEEDVLQFGDNMSRKKSTTLKDGKSRRKSAGSSASSRISSKNGNRASPSSSRTKSQV